MRFVAVIMLRDILVARVSVDPREGETIQDTAYRARETIIRDANRTRPDTLTDQILDGLADAYRDVVASQLITGESRVVTCVSRRSSEGQGRVISSGGQLVHVGTAEGGSVYRMEGHVATLTQKDDFIAIIEAHDDAWIAEREAFTDSIMRSAASA